MKRLRSPKPVDVLKFDYDWCSISHYVMDGQNEIGERTKKFVGRTENVKCAIDVIGQRRYNLSSGTYSKNSYIITFNAGTNVEEGDIVTDSKGFQYTVLSVNDLDTHIEAMAERR